MWAKPTSPHFCPGDKATATEPRGDHRDQKWLLTAPNAGPQSPSSHRAARPSEPAQQPVRPLIMGQDHVRHSREKTTPSSMAFGPREGLFKYQVLRGCHSHVVPAPESHDLSDFPRAKITGISWLGEGSVPSESRG